MENIKTIKDLFEIANDKDDIIVHKTTSLADGFHNPLYMGSVVMFYYHRRKYNAWDNTEIHKIDSGINSCGRKEWYVVLSA